MDVLIRATATGYMVAEPFARERRGEPAIGTRRRRHFSTRTGAIAAALARLPDPRPERPESGLAQGQKPKTLDSLKPSARRVLNYMRSHTGVSKHDCQAWYPAVMNLPGRIYEIREVFGYDAVETVRRGDSGYALYVWRGPDSIQTEMEVA